MKPRGINSLLNKQTSNLSRPSGPTTLSQSGINLGAAAGGSDADKQDQAKASRGGKNSKQGGAKPSSTSAKGAASTLRRTAPGA